MDDVTQKAFDLLAIFADPKRVQQQMNEFVRRKEEAEKAEEEANASRIAAEARLAEFERYRVAKLQEIEAAAKVSDDKAAEAAARIRVATEQAAELLKLRTSLETRSKELAKWSINLADIDRDLHGREEKLREAVERLAEEKEYIARKKKHAEAFLGS